MGINELIGFLVVLFIFFFPIITKLLARKQARTQKKEPIDSEDVQEEEEPEEKPATLPQYHPAPLKFHKLESEIKVRPVVAKKGRQIKVTPKKHQSILSAVIEGKRTDQAMVILHEILRKPKSDEY